MDALIRYGFSVEEIKNIMNTNEDINNITDKEINSIIELLEKYNCKINHIKNIIITNPFLLTRELDDIEKTIGSLLDVTSEVQYLIDTNPFLLNIGERDINSTIRRLNNEGMKKEEILDYFYTNI